MSKAVKFIGPTPHNLTRAANDLALKQFAESNRWLLKTVTRKYNEKKNSLRSLPASE